MRVFILVAKFDSQAAPVDPDNAIQKKINRHI